MKRMILVTLLLSLICLAAVPAADAAIRRVPARYNMLSLYGGYANPHGEYDQIGPIQIRAGDVSLDIEGDSLFDPTYFFGFHYGSFFNRHFLLTIGFRFVDHDVQQWVFDQVDKFDYRNYDLDLNVDIYPFDLTQEAVLSPYVGAGFRAGLTSFEPKGFESESDIAIGLSANFGAVWKIAQSRNGRWFATIASVNSFDFYASSDRPKYLNVGGALRYWFR
mgnify:CR=1 FL=1